MHPRPPPGAFQWTSVELVSFHDELDGLRQKNSGNLSIAGDLYFAYTQWKTMSSKTPFEEEILGRHKNLKMS